MCLLIAGTLPSITRCLYLDSGPHTSRRPRALPDLTRRRAKAQPRRLDHVCGPTRGSGCRGTLWEICGKTVPWRAPVISTEPRKPLCVRGFHHGRYWDQ
jgi:hypothetical protein